MLNADPYMYIEDSSSDILKVAACKLRINEILFNLIHVRFQNVSGDWKFCVNQFNDLFHICTASA